jgi:hypothetical protein
LFVRCDVFKRAFAKCLAAGFGALLFKSGAALVVQRIDAAR